MSRLLYAEKKSSFLGKKYFESMLTLFLIGLLVFSVPFIIAAAWGAWENFVTLTMWLVFIFIFIFILLAGGVLPGLYATKFEIYDDRIILPFPRKPHHRNLFGLPTGETIKKEDIRRADLEVLAENTTFKIKKPGERDSGKKGEWRCAFLLENGELFVLGWYDVQCKEECVPALAEFISGLEDDMSAFFV